MEDVVDEVEDAFDGDDEDDDALSDNSRTSSNERSHSSHHHHRDEDEDEDESGSRSDLQAKGKEVIGMLENPATTPSSSYSEKNSNC